MASSDGSTKWERSGGGILQVYSAEKMPQVCGGKGNQRACADVEMNLEGNCLMMVWSWKLLGLDLTGKYQSHLHHPSPVPAPLC